MVRALVLILGVMVLLWAPWMDTDGVNRLTTQVFDAFGPVPSACYNSDGQLLQEGVLIQWYPMGRLVQTCGGSYVVWMWGSVKEVGGVYKRATDIRAVQGRALTCSEVLARQEARRATTTDSELVFYEGPYAKEIDHSLFPESREYSNRLRTALRTGPVFAGRFAVAEWDCGTSCKNHAVIDAETGLVVGFGPATEYGIDYALDSTILVTNPVRNLPPLPETRYDTETFALGIARVPREYFRLTTDRLSNTQYLVRLCVESGAAGYIEIEDDRLGVIGQ
jgi:hypothetical protein